MPLSIKKKGDKYCVMDGAGKESGCHDTEDEAKKQMAAIMAKESDLAEMDFMAMSMAQQLNHVSTEFGKWFKDLYGQDDYRIPWIRDIYFSHPELGSVIVCSFSGSHYAAGFTVEANGNVGFESRDSWRKVMPTYTLVDSEPIVDNSVMELAESDVGQVIELVESSKDNGNGPVTLKILPILPGPGNKRDGHYYPLDTIARDIHVFEGAKMYLTDHRENEKSVRTEVGTVMRCPDGLNEAGIPYATVGIHDPQFAQSVRNRSELGTLDKLKVSILGNGVAQKGDVDGKSYKIVKSISEGRDIDFVTRAGAGGHAVSLAESEETVKKDKEDEVLEEVAISEDDSKPEQVAEIALAETEVGAILQTSGLPEPAQNRLKIGEYVTETQLREAILTEKQYLSSVVGAGKPVGVGETQVATLPKLTPQERQAKLAEAQTVINSRWLGGNR